MELDKQKIYLIDSDMIINHLRKFFNLFDFLSPLIEEQTVFKVSVISKAEVFAGQSSKLVKQQRLIESIFVFFEVMDITSDIAKKAGEYKRDYRVPLIDAIIAASAVLNKAILITRNTKHFKEILDLEVLAI